ncbi:phosphotransferase enzyme family protein [Altericista sp. CCNU0014]|uniref:phosphotransferase enzyme family protein n=1 Tax=Altericista sp. CCNU0014 TaxID=3082949 RepID=UPI003850282F
MISEPALDPLVAIARQFSPRAAIDRLQPFGNGNINDTFLVATAAEREGRFVLQRINTQVFRQPQLVMQNMRTLTDHVRNRLACDPLSPGCRWQVPKVILTEEGQDHWIDEQGQFWRAIGFIEDSKTFDTIQDLDHAQEMGAALGRFHDLVSDLPPDRLVDTLEGFHITPSYLQVYDGVLATRGSLPQSPEANYCLQFVGDRRALATVLENAKAKGKLPLRTMHGDPKVNNVMFDTATRAAISIIDLDTVKPGLVHYDIGDCLRSACNLLGEETEQWESVQFETDLGEAILRGYLAQSGSFLTENDYDYLYDAIRLLAFELGLRFFTDYLAGNVYFKVKHPTHNLARALVQFKLAESIELQAPTLRTLLQDLR